VAEADDEPEGVELEEDEPDEEDVPLGVLVLDEGATGRKAWLMKTSFPPGELRGGSKYLSCWVCWKSSMSQRGWSSKKRSRMMRPCRSER
jgi:hypothetical protein